MQSSALRWTSLRNGDQKRARAQADDLLVVGVRNWDYRYCWSRGLLYRYETDVDGLPGHEAAFGICSFWAVDHLVCRGDVAAARRTLEHVVSFANDLGLFAEEIVPEDGSQLGNFPQAFTHVGLIFSALSLARPEERRQKHRQP